MRIVPKQFHTCRALRHEGVAMHPVKRTRRRSFQEQFPAAAPFDRRAGATSRSSERFYSCTRISNNDANRCDAWCEHAGCACSVARLDKAMPSLCMACPFEGRRGVVWVHALFVSRALAMMRRLTPSRGVDLAYQRPRVEAFTGRGSLAAGRKLLLKSERVAPAGAPFAVGASRLQRLHAW